MRDESTFKTIEKYEELKGNNSEWKDTNYGYQTTLSQASVSFSKPVFWVASQKSEALSNLKVEKKVKKQKAKQIE